MRVIKRALRGTSFIVTLVLDETQYRHFEAAEGRKPDQLAPMDPRVMREMINLAAHFRKLGPWELAGLVASEVREAMEVVTVEGNGH